MSTTPIDNRKDVLLLMLYSPGRNDAPNERIVGRTRLVKMMFIFKQEALSHFRRGTEITEDNFYEFFPWNFGPFSQQVYDDLTFFLLRGFVETSEAEEEGLPESAEEWHEWLSKSGAGTETAEPEEYREEVFTLTEKGVSYAASLYESLSNSQRQLLKEFKARLTGAPLRGILRYVYQKYPQMTGESKIKEKVLG